MWFVGIRDNFEFVESLRTRNEWKTSQESEKNNRLDSSCIHLAKIKKTTESSSRARIKHWAQAIIGRAQWKMVGSSEWPSSMGLNSSPIDLEKYRQTKHKARLELMVTTKIPRVKVELDSSYSSSTRAISSNVQSWTRASWKISKTHISTYKLEVHLPKGPSNLVFIMDSSP